MATVYIETSIVSYLTARPSDHVVALSRQLLTRRWWDEHRENHDLFTSQFVIDEATRGDPSYAKKRLQLLDETTLLDITPEISTLAEELLSRSILPPNARLDALHIATAAFQAIEILLTWNCKHIANARILPRVYRVLEELGVSRPLICTVEEMIGDDNRIE